MEKTKNQFSGTIFDDVFKTIVEKLPWLLVPLINEVFGTDYEESELVVQDKTEYQTPEGRRTMDSHFAIRGKVYHVECQSTEDGLMIIRMVEYDFHEALERVRTELWQELQKEAGERSSEPLRLKFPQSCVLYLRRDDDTPDDMALDIELPSGEVVRYHVPIIKVQNYTKEAIFQKRLLMLLPFYILRYEKAIKSGRSDFLDEWTAEYTDILNQIQNDREHDISGTYERLIELMVKLA